MEKVFNHLRTLSLGFRVISHNSIVFVQSK
jgi:hypothetical protein